MPLNLSPNATLGRSTLHNAARLGPSNLSFPSDFDPRSLPNLAAWFDARYPAGFGGALPADGTALAQWNDLSGNGRHATQGTGSLQPLWHASGVAFDGADDALVLSGSALSIAQNVGGLSLYAVASHNAGIVVGRIINFTNGTTNYAARAILQVGSYAQLNARRLDADGVTTITGTTDVSATSNAHVFSGVLDYASNVGTIWTDGAGVATSALSSAGNTSNTASQWAGIGNGNVGSSTFPGAITSILVYSAAHTTTQRQAVERWLGRVFGVSVA